MKVHDTTITAWASIGSYGDDQTDDAFAEWVTEALRECAEAAALDFDARTRAEWGRYAVARDVYLTVDGERVHPLPGIGNGLTPSYATAPAENVDPGESF